MLLFNKEALICLKVTVNRFIMLQKISISNKLFSSKNPENNNNMKQQNSFQHLNI